jgi:hypothetical protein
MAALSLLLRALHESVSTRSLSHGPTLDALCARLSLVPAAASKVS